MDLTEFSQALNQKKESLISEREKLRDKLKEDLLSYQREKEAEMLALQKRLASSSNSDAAAMQSKLREVKREQERMQNEVVSRTQELQDKYYQQDAELLQKKGAKIPDEEENLNVLKTFTRPVPSRSRISSNPQGGRQVTDTDVLRVESYLEKYSADNVKSLNLINPFDKLINSAAWISEFSKKNGLTPVMDYELNGLQLSQGKYTIKVFEKGIIEPVVIDPPDKERVFNLIVDLMLKYSEDFQKPSHIMTASDPEDRKMMGKILSQRLIDNKLDHRVDGLSPKDYLDKLNNEELTARSDRNETSTNNTLRM